MPKIPSCSHSRIACGRCRRRALTRPSIAIAAGATFIVLLWFDQDLADPARRRIDLEEAHRLKLLGVGQFVSRGQAFRLHARSPTPKFSYVPSSSPESCEAISLAEMQINVGITSDEVGAPAPRHIVRRVQQKIKNYPLTFDKKAPLAHRRQVKL